MPLYNPTHIQRTETKFHPLSLIFPVFFWCFDLFKFAMNKCNFILISIILKNFEMFTICCLQKRCFSAQIFKGLFRIRTNWPRNFERQIWNTCEILYVYMTMVYIAYTVPLNTVRHKAYHGNQLLQKDRNDC